MPELPEVETVVRTLRSALVGARLAGVETSGLPLRMNRPVDRAALVRLSGGVRVANVRRRGKYILIDLCNHHASAGIVVHLGMSGRLRVQGGDEARAAHTHITWVLDDGRELRFSDPRRFGWVEAATRLEDVPALLALGPDPLSELTAAVLARGLGQSRTPVKSFLLDQRRVAGLGNIYVCEALFFAGINPRARAERVRTRAPRLLDCIRTVLESAIGNRGTTLRDYVDAGGLSGDNQHALAVYGREGAPCRSCGTAIKRTIDANRSTFMCPRCQR